MSTGLADPDVARDRAVADEEQAVAETTKYISVRLTLEMVKEARLAATLAGKSLSEYISDTMLPIARKDAERGWAEREKRAKKGAKE